MVCVYHIIIIGLIKECLCHAHTCTHTQARTHMHTHTRACTHTHTHTNTHRFGPPLILRIWRDLTHSQFQSVVLKSMMSHLREGVKLADICRTGVLFQCRVVDGLPGQCVLPTDTDHPFYSPSIHKSV